MKNTSFIRLVVLFFLSAGVTSLQAQKIVHKDNKLAKFKKKTVMEQFEPELVLTEDARMRLKTERLAMIQKKHRIIDTLRISVRKKRKLLKELYKTPYTYQWDKVIADLKFENTDEY